MRSLIPTIAAAAVLAVSALAFPAHAQTTDEPPVACVALSAAPPAKLIESCAAVIGNPATSEADRLDAKRAGNADLIADFASGVDKLALDDAIFGAGIGTPGSFNANAFFAGTAAHDGDDRIIYNSATGQLFYDADGNGGGAAILFATLQGNPAVTASDFTVI